MWKEKPVKAWDSATGGEHLERLFWDEVKGKDWNELEKHIAPTCVFVGPPGTLDRAAGLKHLQQFEISDITLGEVVVQPNGGDTIVVTYTAHISGKLNGAAAPPTTHMMSVWQKVRKDWMLIAHSVSLAAS